MCAAFSRDKMSVEQLRMLDDLVLAAGTACYLCDASDDFDLVVIDQDGTEAQYAGPHCDCAGEVADTMVREEFFQSFPSDGAAACP
jgi:hypothetical protein